MNLQCRIDLLSRLGQYILSDDPSWLEAKEKASYENSWFVPEFIERSCKNIACGWLQKGQLEAWVRPYHLPATIPHPKTAGIVMAGNIPLVGFHDWLCVFISGHRSAIKASSKDKVLIKYLVDKLIEWDGEIKELVSFREMLKGCDAYIATGSNNTSRYFEYYFGKYPHIIRRNRTSVAVIAGSETPDELEKLADDVYLYFGLGCRNITKIYVPTGYDFIPLLAAFGKYNYLADHHKYKNNYDYNLALHLLNKKYYMTNGSVLLIEEPAFFSPISQLNYEFYDDPARLRSSLAVTEELQCITGKEYIPFGRAQQPALADYADGADTLQFLSGL